MNQTQTARHQQSVRHTLPVYERPGVFLTPATIILIDESWRPGPSATQHRGTLRVSSESPILY